MTRILDLYASAVTSRPRWALGVLLVVTVGLGVGSGLLTEQADTSVFLPDDSEVSVAIGTLSESFPDSAGLTNVTIVHRGDALTPDGLAHIDDVTTAVVADPAVAERLALTDPVASISAIYLQALQVTDLSTVTQEQIDGVTASLENDPELAAVFSSLVGEADGTSLAISSVKLRQLDDADGLAAAERTIADLVTTVDGPLDVSSLSSTTIDDESAESSSSSMSLLLAIAAAVIVLLLFVFFRTASDVALSLAGLGMAIVGTLGFQGSSGPTASTSSDRPTGSRPWSRSS